MCWCGILNPSFSRAYWFLCDLCLCWPLNKEHNKQKYKTTHHLTFVIVDWVPIHNLGPFDYIELFQPIYLKTGQLGLFCDRPNKIRKRNLKKKWVRRLKSFPTRTSCSKYKYFISYLLFWEMDKKVLVAVLQPTLIGPHKFLITQADLSHLLPIDLLNGRII